MADELISRQVLAEEIESLTVTVAGKPARWYDAKHSVLQIIAEQAAVDAVEVVRCKNCARRGDPAECPMCFFIEGDWADYTRDDGYCDRGERREEDAAD